MMDFRPSAKPALVWRGGGREGGREGGKEDCKWTDLQLYVEKDKIQPPTSPFLPPSLPPYPSIIQTTTSDGLEAVKCREEGQLLHHLVLDLGVVQQDLIGGEGREGGEGE